MSAYYNEFDPKAAAWLRELVKQGHIADGVVDERSILDVTPADLKDFNQCHFFAGIGGWSHALRLAGWADDRRVWTGSPPCQPFSAAGRNLGRDDERHLAPHFVRLVGACRPPVLFGEQVASAAVFGPAAKGNRPGFAGAPPWAWIDDLCDRLEAAHYAVGAGDIPAAGVGAPHIRQRTFFGAQRLDDPAGPRHDGPFAGPEGLARDEARLRVLGAGSKFVRLADTAASQRPDAADGQRGTADWIFCRDGKWRPVEPGTFPLAHGVSARVGRLRGYGNAIVPQAAAEFICAFDEVTA